MDPPVARDLWQPYEAVHDVVYFADEPRRAARDVGLRGFWMGYVAMRAAPLGAIGPGPVTALFHGFHPDRIARALPDAWGYADPGAVLDARRSSTSTALRRLGVPGRRDTEEAADLAWRAAQAVDVAGRALGAANRDLDRPGEPLDVLWQATTTLREHRGDGHVAVLLARGLSPVEAHLVKVAAGETGEEMLRDARQWPPQEWDTGRAGLRERGWLDDAGHLTDAGAAEHRRIEDDTDRLATAPWSVLSPAEVERLVELLDPLADLVHRSGILPTGNPTGLTADRR